MTKTASTFGNRVMDINPEDIESMSVLKGGSSCRLVRFTRSRRGNCHHYEERSNRRNCQGKCGLKIQLLMGQFTA